MTREEAIADLKSINATGMECIDYAITVLEQLTSDDCVSRQAITDAVENTIAKYIPIFLGRYEKIPLELALAISNVPPVTPIFPKGATNGDILKIVFPNIEWEEIHDLKGDKNIGCTNKFWNTPYKLGNENG